MGACPGVEDRGGRRIFLALVDGAYSFDVDGAGLDSGGRLGPVLLVVRERRISPHAGIAGADGKSRSAHEPSAGGGLCRSRSPGGAVATSSGAAHRRDNHRPGSPSPGGSPQERLDGRTGGLPVGQGRLCGSGLGPDDRSAPDGLGAGAIAGSLDFVRRCSGTP